MLIAAVMGCGGSTAPNCRSPSDVCPGANDATVEYLCDGGPCPAGVSTGDAYFQCACPNVPKVYVVKQPGSDAECSAARNAWTGACR